MKNVVYIDFSASKIPGGAATILVPTGCGPDVAQVREYLGINSISVSVTLEKGDERVAKIFALTEKLGVETSVVHGFQYTEEDRQSALLLRTVAYESVFAGPRLGTKYDMTDACPTCGTGARQTSPLYVDYKALPTTKKSRAIKSYYGDLLVNAAIEKKLQEAGVAGIAFGEVYVRLKNKERMLVPRKQVLVSHVMPPLSPKSSTTTDLSDLCKTCRRAGMSTPIGTALRLAYRRQDLTDIQDFNLTWEWFGGYRYDGNVKDALFASPSILVTPKVMNIFREAGVKNFDWIPIAVDE